MAQTAAALAGEVSTGSHQNDFAFLLQVCRPGLWTTTPAANDDSVRLASVALPSPEPTLDTLKFFALAQSNNILQLVDLIRRPCRK